MIDAAEALQHAHEAGIIHRDLKPSNLMVDTAEHCWVLDFGLAGYLKAQANGHAHDGPPAPEAKPAIDLGPEPDPPTMSGVVGTPDYMAPEQFQGRADTRTDVWGLGVILYELLTLQRAFHGRKEIESSDPPRPRDLVHGLPLDLDAICCKAIRKEPAQRYPSARALADDLRHWLKSEPVQARPAHTLRRVLLWAKRNKGWAAAIALATLAFASISVAAIYVNKTRADAARAVAVAAGEKEHEAEERGRGRAGPSSARLDPADAAGSLDLSASGVVEGRMGPGATSRRDRERFANPGRDRRQPGRPRRPQGQVASRSRARRWPSTLGKTLDDQWFEPASTRARAAGPDLGQHHRRTPNDRDQGRRGLRLPARRNAADSDDSPGATLRRQSSGTCPRRRLLQTFKSPIEGKSMIRALALTPDGTSVAVSANALDDKGEPADTGVIAVWEAASGREVFRYSSTRATEVALSPDGSLLAAGHE